MGGAEQQLLRREVCRYPVNPGVGVDTTFPGLRYTLRMLDRNTAIAALRSSENDLRSMGVMHAAIFGSVARGANTGSSDLDVMIDLDPNARITLIDYVGIRRYISGLFDVPVDVVIRSNLKPFVGATALSDAVDVF